MKIKDKDFSFQAVPQEKRNSFIKMLMVMLGFTFFSASMWAGGSLGVGMTFTDLLAVILLGNVILGAYTGSLAYIGAKTGLSTHLLAQYAFGKKGAYISSMMVSVTQVGWFGVGIGMFAYPVHLVTDIPVLVLVVVFGIIMTITAYAGMKALTILSCIAVPAIAVLGSVSTGMAVDELGGVGALLAYTPESSAALTFSAALTITIGSFISGGSVTPDFARYAKNGKQALITTVIAFFLGNTLMFLFGAIGVIATGHSDISDVMFAQGLIIPAVLVLGLNIWTTNDNALYASGLGLATIFKKPKVLMVMANGFFGTLFATTLYAHFQSWLTLLGSTLPAIGAIIVTDFFFVRKRAYVEYEKAEIKNVHIPAIIAWGIGICAGLFLPGISSLNSLFVTGIVYFIAVKIMDTEVVREQVEEEVFYEKVG